MADPSIIPRLQKLNLSPDNDNPFRRPSNIPEVTCDACGSFRNVRHFVVVIGVTEFYGLCETCYAQVFRHRCAMCRQEIETTLVRMEDAHGCGYWDRFCARCAADENTIIERGKCGLANVRRNYERVTDLMSVEEMIQRERDKH